MKTRLHSFSRLLLPLLLATVPFAQAQEPRAASRALCDGIHSVDVREAIGGTPGAGTLDYDSPDLGIACGFVDENNNYRGLTFTFHTSADLSVSEDHWDTAAEYFEEFTRKGTTVANLGDAAAWTDDMFTALYVLRGDMALRITADHPDFNDPAHRARFEALARKVVAGLPY